MEQFVRVTGTAAVLLRPNIDTDQIIPAGELIRAGREGHAASLFAGWRYFEGRRENLEFLLNREPWRHAMILLAGPNFGCGSSREAAVWALRQYGFRSVIAPSFGGIFYNNCFRNGVLPVELDLPTVRRLAGQVETSQGRAAITVDLEAGIVLAPDGERIPFRVSRPNREMLLSGLDQVDLTLRHADAIAAFRVADHARRPWAYQTGESGTTVRRGDQRS